MRYLCPICRASCHMRTEDLSTEKYDSTLCSECQNHWCVYNHHHPSLGEQEPRLPWKRAAMRIVARARWATMMRIRAEEAREFSAMIRESAEARTGTFHSFDSVLTRDGSDVESPRNRFVTFSNGELVPVYIDVPVIGANIRQPPGTGGDSPPST